ncbi:hypothetical protein PR202_ga30178 [Eleusine coracana subsp. coracana]|uniref:Uncharacterized protein n=1 Tax=Eleusine coracana subsp. coracana TaxID=191504 RepID=A0AAV5DP14_ELECO|nr:hypothetical protein QOZ80_4AG0328430 [Eleusine coracana subsp. coracana]GJN11940.1 hypothetical protein PR202_ga30178 [Eleusine coracana subsp. coracana]
MGTGWRRALCTSVQRDDEHDKTKKRRPHAAGSFFFFSKGSNPSTPTLRCRTKPLQEPAPVTPPSAPAPMRKPRMPLLQTLSAPSSPRSPSRFALFKASLLPSKSRCGVCSRGVKSSGSSAVFTAECSHSFHFPCIAGHARWSSGVLSCPVCASAWRQAPSLSSLQEQGAPKLMKLYDDDEPLVGFNPIPEEDDDVISSSDTNNDLKASAAVVVVTVAPEAALVSSGRRHGKYVVALKVKASRRGRAPIDLVTVLDVGHGMMGEKLQTLKRGMRLVLASLGPADRLSIVAFSGGAAKRLLPLRRMTRQGQRSARQIVDRLVVSAASSSSSSSSSVGDALRKATKVLEDRRERNPVATVMLLSDITKQQQQQEGANKQRHKATTRFTHVEIPIGDAPPLLDKCLVSVVMQDVHLDLHFPAGEITAVYSTGQPHHHHHHQQQQLLAGNEIVSVWLGEMYADEERELLLELRAPLTVINHHDSQQQLLSVRCSYGDPWSHDTVRGAHQPLLLPPLHHQRGGGGSRRGGRLHDLFVATRAVAESRRLADLHDLPTAIHLLSSARALLLMQSPPSQDLVATIDTELRGMRTPSTSTPPPPPEPSSLTPTSAWRAAEQLAKVAIMRKSMNRVSDLHGFDNARF